MVCVRRLPTTVSFLPASSSAADRLPFIHAAAMRCGGMGFLCLLVWSMGFLSVFGVIDLV